MGGSLDITNRVAIRLGSGHVATCGNGPYALVRLCVEQYTCPSEPCISPLLSWYLENERSGRAACVEDCGGPLEEGSSINFNYLAWSDPHMSLLKVPPGP